MAGLTPSAITHIIRELLSKNLVVETGEFAGLKGRKAIALEINPDGRFVLGIRLARNYVTGGLFNLHGELLRSERVETVNLRQVDQFIRTMKRILWRLLENEETAAKTMAIGVGVPGPISIREGRITFISNFPGWRNIPIKEIIQNEFGIETIVEHDAQAAALAEKWFGVGQEAQNLVYVAAGRGVGAGIILGGEPCTSPSNIAGEIGHMSIDYNGPRCECGNFGCLELYCSSTALVRSAQYALNERTQATVLSEIAPQSPEPIFKAARDGDEVAVSLIKNAATYLAYGVVSLINVFNPDMVILGDEMAQAGDIWVDTVKQAAFSRLLPEVAGRIRIEAATLKGDPFLIGTGTVAIEHLFNNP